MRLLFLVLPLPFVSAYLVASSSKSGDQEILNVSYDPTRELYRQLNRSFVQQYEKETGQRVRIRASHGGSTNQARLVMDGLAADVVSLAMWSDVDLLACKGLIRSDWEQRLPHRALPYYSTIVMVVRKGNPFHIQDWPDLLHPDVKIITANPKTGGGAKLNLLAAWGAELRRTGSQDAAKQFIQQLYRRVPVLDSGARGATITFARRGIGDVHLTWENEALMEQKDPTEELEIIYPKSGSILAEPPVALVDANVDRKQTRTIGEAYLQYLFTADGQRIIAANGYRPRHPEVIQEFGPSFPGLIDPKQFPLFSLQDLGIANWNVAIEQFFGDGGLFDQIYTDKLN